MADRTAQPGCSVTAKFGFGCGNPSLPDAPFPICLKHASRVLSYLNSFVNDGSSSAIMAVRDMEAEPDAAPPVIPEDGVSIVYYLRVGKYIKIGHTINPAQRLRTYPPDAELLAYELGDRALERARIKAFLKARRGRHEWFEPTAELLAHIDSVRTAHTELAA